MLSGLQMRFISSICCLFFHWPFECNLANGKQSNMEADEWLYAKAALSHRRPTGLSGRIESHEGRHVNMGRKFFFFYPDLLDPERCTVRFQSPNKLADQQRTSHKEKRETRRPRDDKKANDWPAQTRAVPRFATHPYTVVMDGQIVKRAAIIVSIYDFSAYLA